MVLLVAKRESPEYVAVSVCVPLASAELENVHDPLLRVQIVSVVEPSCNVTHPVGVPPALLPLIVHETERPTIAGLLELVRAVVVVARVAFTT